MTSSKIAYGLAWLLVAVPVVGAGILIGVALWLAGW